MKAVSLHTLKRFLHLLLTNRDISDERNADPTDASDENPVFAPQEDMNIIQDAGKSIRIQPEEIGELEHINIFPDQDERGTLVEAEDYHPHEIFTEVLQGNSAQPISETPEDVFYDYALDDTPAPVLQEDIEPKEEPIRKNKKLISLRDVLVERGNFWEENSKRSRNIWERDTEMPEEEMIIDGNTLVGDVIFEEKKHDEELEKI